MTPPITILCATFNARQAVRLTLLSLRRYTPEPHVLLVADNGSTDGTLEDLQALRWLRLIRLESDHGGALDYLATLVKTPHFLTLDSDVEFLECGWLTAMLDLVQRENLDAIGIYEPGIGNYQPRLAPHLCVFRTETFRQLATSFREVAYFTDQVQSTRFRARDPAQPLTSTELETYPDGRFYPTGARVFEQLSRRGGSWAEIPGHAQRAFHHLGHMSWNARENRRTYVNGRLAKLSGEPDLPPARAGSA